MLSLAYIAKDFGCHINTVKNWVSKKTPAHRRLKSIKTGKLRRVSEGVYLKWKQGS